MNGMDESIDDGIRNVTGAAGPEEEHHAESHVAEATLSTGIKMGRLSDYRTALGSGRAAPQLSQLDAHLRRLGHVLYADPLVRPMNVLHPGKQIGCR